MKKRPVKERLINTAAELFYKNGYNSTGINEILAKSGVAKASMYQHFRSKEEIGLAYLQHMDAESSAALKERLSNTPDGKEKLFAIIDHVEAFYNERHFNGCWSLNALAEMSGQNALMSKEVKAQKGRMRALFFKLVSEHLNVPNPETVADQLYLQYEVALMESKVFNDKWPIEVARGLFEKIID